MIFLKQLKAYWQENNFAPKGNKILVAVSGGRDSMALAFALHQIGHNLSVAHCNFQLRGADADADEEFVRSWCVQHNIPFWCIRFDTRNEMKIQKMGVQETARKLRYDWFELLKNEHQFAAIATAHHANDNAETMLINLCKGTGISGLCGIPPKNRAIIRPLLFAPRQAIDDFVAENKIQYREDRSNQSDDYLRNKLRHNVVPVLEACFPDLIRQLNTSIQNLRSVEQIYTKSIVQLKKKLYEVRGKDLYLSIHKLKQTEGYEAICYEVATEFGFSAAQSQELIQLIDSDTGKYIQSVTHKIINNRGFLIITPIQDLASDFILIEEVNHTVSTQEGNFTFCSLKAPQKISLDPLIALLDQDQLEPPLILRRWKKADYFYPLGMTMKKKKVSKYLIDQKIPLPQKERLWVLESNKKIVWLCGQRLDERFKIRDKTKNILQIHFSPK